MGKEKVVSLKELRATFYRLRDFEISHLWQRSVFLSALLVLFFPAYGFLVSKLLENGSVNILVNIPLIHVLCCLIALLAIIFSAIWIMMAKGSKAWYEVYERKISEIEKEAELKIPARYQMGKGCVPWELDSKLWTTKPGRYSVSKLNIIIGIALMIIWTLVFIVHMVAICPWDICGKIVSYVEENIFCILLVIFGVIMMLITIPCLNRWARSGILNNDGLKLKELKDLISETKEQLPKFDAGDAESINKELQKLEETLFKNSLNVLKKTFAQSFWGKIKDPILNMFKGTPDIDKAMADLDTAFQRILSREIKKVKTSIKKIKDDSPQNKRAQELKEVIVEATLNMFEGAHKAETIAIISRVASEADKL